MPEPTTEDGAIELLADDLSNAPLAHQMTATFFNIALTLMGAIEPESNGDRNISPVLQALLSAAVSIALSDHCPDGPAEMERMLRKTIEQLPRARLALSGTAGQA